MSDGVIEPPGPLVGRWEKVAGAACADKYPQSISFSTGTYRGARGPGQGMVWWDAGIYRLEGLHKLLLSVATDELIAYEIELTTDRFEITDPDGCRFGYRRLPA